MRATTWAPLALALAGAAACDDGGGGPCVPDCTSAECGNDGCGGSCGSCGDPFVCSWWTCVCPADTQSCGESCCGEGEVCRDGECCTRHCDGRECGDDGCGGTCGPGCAFGEVCDAALGQCLSAWVRVPAGTFVMGSETDEVGRAENESAHEVTLTRDFEIFATEITRQEFAEVAGYEPRLLGECDGSCPATFVSWHEAAAFCNALSDREGLAPCYDCTGEGDEVTCEASAAYPTPYACPGYRLPTEAEWERAARSGTSTATYNGDLPADALACESPNETLDSIAWFCGTSATDASPGGVEHPVSTLEPNVLGLYDMLGNVAEWCHDACPMRLFSCEDYEWGPAVDPFGVPSSSIHAVRGGSWSSDAAETRAAVRASGEPDHRAAVWGFRPARTAAR